ncbi:hypothetical protein EVAR_85398_1 [Eumeta japonica]|uniref:Uncharacterized protein n=1 Tax=Eumeta variegata TaxID=151549 RepID=A0A4C1SJJ5_EUMVA|nr:hypothetical protein EVAR_85398_1 [Eumeta japonica]
MDLCVLPSPISDLSKRTESHVSLATRAVDDGTLSWPSIESRTFVRSIRYSGVPRPIYRNATIERLKPNRNFYFGPRHRSRIRFRSLKSREGQVKSCNNVDEKRSVGREALITVYPTVREVVDTLTFRVPRVRSNLHSPRSCAVRFVLHHHPQTPLGVTESQTANRAAPRGPIAAGCLERGAPSAHRQPLRHGYRVARSISIFTIFTLPVLSSLNGPVRVPDRRVGSLRNGEGAVCCFD